MNREELSVRRAIVGDDCGCDRGLPIRIRNKSRSKGDGREL